MLANEKIWGVFPSLIIKYYITRTNVDEGPIRFSVRQIECMNNKDVLTVVMETVIYGKGRPLAYIIDG